MSEIAVFPTAERFSSTPFMFLQSGKGSSGLLHAGNCVVITDLLSFGSADGVAAFLPRGGDHDLRQSVCP